MTRNQRTGAVLFGLVFGMTALAFASVPLYRLYCQVTGYGGNIVNRADSFPTVQLDRQVRVQFMAAVDPGLPWVFRPEESSQTLKIGEPGLIKFIAYNKSSAATSGTAIYNIAPDEATRYFHKVQCFCFQEQALKPGEHAEMPVSYFIDPAINDDPDLKGLSVVTLSYTFYPSQSEALDTAISGDSTTRPPAVN